MAAGPLTAPIMAVAIGGTISRDARRVAEHRPPAGDLVEVEPGAEGGVRAGQHDHGDGGVGVELGQHIGQTVEE